MENINYIGGARIGVFNYTWPFARLTITPSKIILNTIFHKLVFKKSDINKIKLGKTLPFIGKGIELHHSVKKYSKSVIFWYFTNDDFIIQELIELGWEI